MKTFVFNVCSYWYDATKPQSKKFGSNSVGPLKALRTTYKNGCTRTHKISAALTPKMLTICSSIGKRTKVPKRKLQAMGEAHLLPPSELLFVLDKEIGEPIQIMDNGRDEVHSGWPPFSLDFLFFFLLFFFLSLSEDKL